MKVDFPALGNPNNPTSAKTFNSNFTCNLSPFSPSVVFLGALLVEDLKRALPIPPLPPQAISKVSSYEVMSQITSSVSSLIICVPIGTFRKVSGASFPCLSLP